MVLIAVQRDRGSKWSTRRRRTSYRRRSWPIGRRETGCKIRCSSWALLCGASLLVVGVRCRTGGLGWRRLLAGLPRTSSTRTLRSFYAYLDFGYDTNTRPAFAKKYGFQRRLEGERRGVDVTRPGSLLRLPPSSHAVSNLFSRTLHRAARMHHLPSPPALIGPSRLSLLQVPLLTRRADIGSNLGDPVFRGHYHGKQAHTGTPRRSLARRFH